MTKARTYPKANRTQQWWEGNFSRGTFSRIEKILLHTTETTGWPGYKSGASAPTLTYHPRLRAWRQHNYLDTSARALVDPSGTAVRENRDNVIQIEIIAYSDERIGKSVGGLLVSQLTDAHYRDLAEFFAFVRKEWGGPPLVAPKFIAYPGSYGNSSVRMSGPEYDRFQGLVGHQHASGNDHGDPSNIDAQKILRYVREIEGGTTTPTVPEEDDVSAADVWNHPTTNASGKKATMGGLVRWGYINSQRAANKADAAVQKVAELAGQIAGLSNALAQHAEQPGQPLDLAAVTAAAKAGAAEAIQAITVTVEGAENTEETA